VRVGMVTCTRYLDGLERLSLIATLCPLFSVRWSVVTVQNLLTYAMWDECCNKYLNDSI